MDSTAVCLHPALSFNWIVKFGSLILLKTESNTLIFAFLSSPTEMTSPVITVRNATSEYSGTYSCTVQNRVGSDQCLLSLDVVPRKCLLWWVFFFPPCYHLTAS